MLRRSAFARFLIDSSLRVMAFAMLLSDMPFFANRCSFCTSSCVHGCRWRSNRSAIDVPPTMRCCTIVVMQWSSQKAKRKNGECRVPEKNHHSIAGVLRTWVDFARRPGGLCRWGRSKYLFRCVSIRGAHGRRLCSRSGPVGAPVALGVSRTTATCHTPASCTNARVCERVISWPSMVFDIYRDQVDIMQFPPTLDAQTMIPDVRLARLPKPEWNAPNFSARRASGVST